MLNFHYRIVVCSLQMNRTSGAILLKADSCAVPATSNTLITTPNICRFVSCTCYCITIAKCEKCALLWRRLQITDFFSFFFYLTIFILSFYSLIRIFCFNLAEHEFQMRYERRRQRLSFFWARKRELSWVTYLATLQHFSLKVHVNMLKNLLLSLISTKIKRKKLQILNLTFSGVGILNLSFAVVKWCFERPKEVI